LKLYKTLLKYKKLLIFVKNHKRRKLN